MPSQRCAPHSRAQLIVSPEKVEPNRYCTPPLNVLRILRDAEDTEDTKDTEDAGYTRTCTEYTE